MIRKISFGEDIKLDNGVFFGAGVFETILILEKPIFLDFHIKRLNLGIVNLGLGEEVEKEEIEDIITKYKNCVLKIVVTEKNLIIETRKNNYTDEDY